jgi:hypothetical protein
MSLTPNDFDPLAIIVDWLDACRSGNLSDVLEFYDEQATLECGCEAASLTGRVALSAYWAGKLRNEFPNAFTLDDLAVREDGVWVDYRNNKGRRIRARFRFNEVGKIIYTSCGPLLQRLSA